MSINFGTMKTNIGVRIGDTSDSFATTIGVYINQRYKDVLRRTNWNAINDSYVVSATSAATSYFLPANFGKELYVYDQVQLVDIPYMSYEELEQEYQTEKNNSGTVEYYTIIHLIDASATTSARTKKIKFWRSVTTSACFEVPYTIYPVDLSGATDELVVECERAVDYGATSDAWMTKRNFAKAQYYEALYEKEIQNLMWNQSNQPNQIPLFSPMALNRNEGI